MVGAPLVLPVRVAIVSPNHVVRAGLVSLIAQLRSRAVVTTAVTDDVEVRHCDVAIFDLDRLEHDPGVRAGLSSVLGQHVPVVGVVYGRDVAPAWAPLVAGVRVVPLSVTPAQMMLVLLEESARERGGRARRTKRLPAQLTPQEFCVLELVGAGLTNDAIARELFVSINTVKTYVRTSYRKVGVTDRASAVLWALAHGLAGGPRPSR